MFKIRSHWACLSCAAPGDQVTDQGPPIVGDFKGLKVLNLYAGIGGNRKLWEGCQVTAVESHAQVAAAYKTLYPEDTLIVGDAHQYLLKHYPEYDFIWISPPCPTHSRLNYANLLHMRKYPDMHLYQEIILLKHFYKGRYVVENVFPYYEALIKPTARISRHCFWSNFPITEIEHKTLPDFITLHNDEHKKQIQDWLGIYVDRRIYMSGKNYLQVFRNCVHPDVGLSIFKDMLASLQIPSSTNIAITDLAG